MELFDAEKWLNDHIAELNKADAATEEATSRLAAIQRILDHFELTTDDVAKGLLEEELMLLRSELEKGQAYLDSCKEKARIAHAKLRVIEPIRAALLRKKELRSN